MFDPRSIEDAATGSEHGQMRAVFYRGQASATASEQVFGRRENEEGAISSRAATGPWVAFYPLRGHLTICICDARYATHYRALCTLVAVRETCTAAHLAPAMAEDACDQSLNGAGGEVLIAQW